MKDKMIHHRLPPHFHHSKMWLKEKALNSWHSQVKSPRLIAFLQLNDLLHVQIYLKVSFLHIPLALLVCWMKKAQYDYKNSPVACLPLCLSEWRSYQIQDSLAY